MNAIIEKINSLGCGFVDFALPMLIQASVLIVLLLLADLLLRRRVRAVFRYWIWMLVLVKLVLPTSLSGPFSVGYWFGDEIASVDIGRLADEPEATPSFAESTPKPQLPYIEFTDVRPIPIERPAAPAMVEVEAEAAVEAVGPPAVPLKWQGVVFLLWAAVAGALILLLAQRAIFVRGLVGQSKDAEPAMCKVLDDCRERMKVRSKPSLKISPNAASPAVCGLFRPVILVPSNLSVALDSEDLRVVLLHELAHVKRRDLWVNLAQTLLQIAYFYNPLLWLANGVIRKAREQAVDEAVLVAMGEKAGRYPETLVSVAKLAFERPTLSLRLIGVVESKSALTARIKRILSRPMPKSAKLGILGLLIIVVAAVILLPMAKENEDDLELIVKEYRLKHPLSPAETTLYRTISDALKEPLSDLIKDLMDKDMTKSYRVWDYRGLGKVIVAANKRQHRKVEKALRKKYRDLLRPENLHDVSSVADKDAFADNCRKIAEDVFTRLNFTFLTEEDIDYIADDIGDFVRTYTRDDVPNEIRLRILDSLDLYLYSTFYADTINVQERVYLTFDEKVKTLKLKLWQVIAKEPLTEAERATFVEQKQWIYDYAQTLPSRMEKKRIEGMLRIDAVFDDILNGFSTQPMSEKTFKKFQEKLRGRAELVAFAATASCWSTEIALEKYRKNREPGYRWPFPFGVVTGYSGGSDRVDFDFESEKPHMGGGLQLNDVGTRRQEEDYNAYDIASRKGLKAPESCTTDEKLEEWLNEQDMGDLYYDLESESIVSCRGARMAVLDVNNWIEADLISTEEVLDAIRAKPISRFSVSGFKNLRDSDSDNKDKPVVPIIAVETAHGHVSLVRPNMGTPFPKMLKFGVRHRFEGWEEQWFGTFITGETGYPMRDRRTARLRVNHDHLRASFPDLSGHYILESHGSAKGQGGKYVKEYERARKPLDVIFGQDGKLFTEEIYKESMHGFERLAENSEAYPLSLYARRWIIILDWLAQKQHAFSAARALDELAAGQSNRYEANLSRAYAAIVLARDGYLEEAVQSFVQCRAEQTPQWGWFVFAINRLFNEYVERAAPDVTRREGKTLVQKARTQKQLQEIEKPLRRAQTAYADYLEHQLLPLAAGYITSEAAEEYKHVERIQIIDSLRQMQISHLSSLELGAATGQISERVKESIRPKVLAVWRKGLTLLEDEKSFKAYSKEIQTRCKKFDIPLKSLDRHFESLEKTALPLPEGIRPGYTERAGDVIRLAEVEARRLNHAYVGTEHILLALAGQGDAVAGKVLAKLGIGKEALDGELKKIVKTGAEAVTQSSLPQTPRARKALEYARSEAKTLDHRYIGTEHILLGLMQEKDGVGARMLVNLGVSYDAARAEVLGFVKPGPGVKAEGGEESATGRVVDGKGRGVAGATMKFSRWDWEKKKVVGHRLIEAADDGSFVIPYIEPGRRGTFANITAPGFATRDDIDFGRRADGTYAPGRQTIRLLRLSSISGTVLGPDGKPLAGAPLSLSTSVKYPRNSSATANDERAITDSTGQFSMDVPPGTHLLYYPWSGPLSDEVDNGKWDAWLKPGEVYPSAPVKNVMAARFITIAEGEKTDDIEFDLSKSTCSVEGRVRDIKGRPVAGARIGLFCIYESGGWVLPMSDDYEAPVTDKNGHYRFENLMPGDWHIYAWHDKIKQRGDPVAVRLVSGKTIRQDFHLAEEVPVEIEKSEARFPAWDKIDSEELYREYELGPEVELVVQDAATGEKFMVDLESGKVLTPDKDLAAAYYPDQHDRWALRIHFHSPDEADRFVKWIDQSGADIVAESGRGLQLIGGASSYYAPGQPSVSGWDDVAVEEVVNKSIAHSKAADGKKDISAVTSGLYDLDESKPVWHFVTTRDGTPGIVQVLEITDKPKGVRFRYRLVQKKRAKYSAKLANGVTVELVGLFSGVKKDERVWWRADGMPLGKDSFQAYAEEVEPMVWDDLPKRRLLYGYVFTASPANVVKLINDVSEGDQWHTDYVDSKETARIGYAYSHSIEQQENPPEVGGIKIAAAIGEAERLESKVYSGSVEDMHILKNGANVIVSGPREYRGYDEKMVDIIVTASDIHVAVSYELKNGDIKAADLVGAMGGPSIVSFYGTQKPLHQHSFRVFDPWDKITKFIVDFRKYELVTFKNVALKPGFKADVRIEVDKGGSHGSGGNSTGTVNISLQERTAVRDALTLLGKSFEKNIIVSDKVAGVAPALNLFDVTFEEALQAILGTHKYVIDGKFIRVYTKEEFETVTFKDKADAEVDSSEELSGNTAVNIEHYRGFTMPVYDRNASGFGQYIGGNLKRFDTDYVSLERLGFEVGASPEEVFAKQGQCAFYMRKGHVFVPIRGTIIAPVTIANPRPEKRLFWDTRITEMTRSEILRQMRDSPEKTFVGGSIELLKKAEYGIITPDRRLVIMRVETFSAYETGAEATGLSFADTGSVDWSQLKSVFIPPASAPADGNGSAAEMDEDGGEVAKLDISGLVTDEDGAPLAGAGVGVMNKDLVLSGEPEKFSEREHFVLSAGAYRVTDSDGRFKLTCLRPGRTDITVRMEGFRTAFVKDVSTGTSNLKIALGEPSPYTLSGKVRDVEGKPLSGVDITLSSDSPATVQTDDGGDFRFETVNDPAQTPHSHRLFARKKGFGVWGKSLDGSGAETFVEITLQPETAVSGWVTDTGGEPIADANVGFWSCFGKDTDFSYGSHRHKIAPKVKTGADGEFVLKGMPQESIVSVHVEADRYAHERIYGIKTGTFNGYAREIKRPDAQGLMATGWMTMGVSHEAGEKIEVKLQRGATLGGVAVYEDSERPAQALRITTQPYRAGAGATGAQTRTDEDGRFKLEGVYPGPCNLLVRLENIEEDSLPEWAAAAIEYDGLENGEVRDDIRIVLTRGGVVRGKALDSKGNPLRGIDIAFYSAARPRSGAACQSTRTRNDGSWSYRFPPGEVYVYIRTDIPGGSWSKSNYTLNLEKGQVIDNIDFTLSREVAENSPYRRAPANTAAVQVEGNEDRLKAAISEILASLKAKLVEMSSDYPELADAKDIRIEGALEGTPLYGLDYRHNCRYWGKRGHEDTGPHAVHIEFRITAQPKDGEGFNFQTTPPTETWPALNLVGWTRVYVGKDASPGFEAKMREVVDQYVEMINELDRRAKAIPPPNADAMRVAPEGEWGEALDGVEVRLKSRRASRKWRADEPYLFGMFEVDLRSTRERLLPRGLGGTELEVEWNGRWYSRSQTADLIRSVGPAKSKHREGVQLLLHRGSLREKGGDGVGPEYTPGKHTVRVAFLAPPADGDKIESIRAVSKPVEIEITPVEESRFPWGSGGNGVQVRLRPEKLVWNEGEDPAFKIDIRNVGTRQMQTSLIASMALEVDGKACPPRAWRQLGLILKRPFAPGDQHTISARLSSFDMPKEAAGKLSPGKHTIKAVYLNNRSEGGIYTSLDKYSEMASASSNTVEIEIAAEAASSVADLFAQARLADYSVGPAWFRAMESLREDMFEQIHWIVKREQGLNQILDDWAAWKYQLDKVDDRDSAMAIFKRFCEQFDSERAFSTLDIRARAIKLICDKLDVNELMDRYVRALQIGKSFYSMYSGAPTSLSIHDHARTMHHKAGDLPASLSAIWYALRQYDAKLDARFPESTNIIEGRLTPILIRQYEVRENGWRQLDQAILLGGPSVAEFLLEQDWRDESDDNVEFVCSTRINKWLIALVNLDDPAGRKFRAENKDVVVALADKWSVWWNGHGGEYDTFPRFFLFDRDRGKRSFAWEYWPRFSAHMDSISYAMKRLRKKFGYLAMLEPLSDLQMYVDSWRDVYENRGDSSVYIHDAMNPVPTRMRVPLARAILREATQRLDAIGPWTTENRDEHGQLDDHVSALNRLLSREATPTRTDGIDAEDKGAVHQEELLVWGEEVGGLRAAVEFVPDKASYVLGERADVRLHIKNVSEKDVEFASESTRQDYANVKDSEGKEVKVDRRWHSGTVGPRKHIIKPGDVLVLDTTGIGFGDIDDKALITPRKEPYYVGSIVHCNVGEYFVSYPVNRNLVSGRRKVTITPPPQVDPRKFELTLNRVSMLETLNELMRKYRARICFEHSGSDSGVGRYVLSGTFFGSAIPELLDKLTEGSPYKWEKINRTYVVYPKQGSVLNFTVKTNISNSPLSDVVRMILDQNAAGKEIGIRPAYQGRMRPHLWISQSNATYAVSRATEGVDKGDVVWLLTEAQGRCVLSFHKLGQAEMPEGRTEDAAIAPGLKAD